MGKTREEAINLYNDVDKIYCEHAKRKDDDYASYQLLETYKAYIRKAVKRGRHKERKRWMKVFEQLKFDAKMDKQRKSFDAEKVKEMIGTIWVKRFLQGWSARADNRESEIMYGDKSDEVFKDLYAELGIE